MSDNFVYDEIDRKVWEEELSPYLPDKIYDIHCHAWRGEEYISSESADPSVPNVVEVYPLETLRSVHHRLFAGKQIEGLIFGLGEKDTDYDAQGRWLAAAAPKLGYQTLLFAPPTWDERVLERQVAYGHLGFKPYWLLAGEKLDEVELKDMISPAMLRVADRHGLIIMTHIPRTGRLTDIKNLEGLQYICQAAPNAKFILAHFGRSYFPEALKYLDLLAALPNLWADCSFVQDFEVYEQVFSLFPRNRIMFGSDLPISQEKGKLIAINGQRHFFTAKPHPWSVHLPSRAYEIRCTLFVYEIIRALLRGAQRAGLTQQEIHALFWDNAKRLISSVKGFNHA